MVRFRKPFSRKPRHANTLPTCSLPHHTPTAHNKGWYKGSYDRGLRHGAGSRVFSNGNRYEGQWRLGQPDGEGLMQYANGNQYVGEWQQGNLHGRGLLTYAHGDAYEGDFFKGVFYGRGRYNFADGGYYEGEYLAQRGGYEHGVLFPEPNGKRHGRGIRVWVSGTKYEGQWIDDRMTGKGVITTLDGGCYEGHFHDGQRDGHGTEEYGNLSGVPYVCPLGYRHPGAGHCRYVGDWKNSQFHGCGEFTCVDGRYYKGEWVQGKPHGPGELFMLPEHHAGDPDRLFVGGVDAMYRIIRHEGMFEAGVRNGAGKSFYSNGDTVEGEFDRGRPVGRCTYTHSGSGRERHGLWINGVLSHWIEGEEVNFAAPNANAA